MSKITEKTKVHIPSATPSHEAYNSFSVGKILLEVHDNFAAIEKPWRDLQSAAPSIYQSYEWQKAWFETIGKAEGAILFCIIGYQETRPIFLLPFCITPTFSANKAEWLGGKHANYKAGLFAQDAPSFTKAELTEILQKSAQYAACRLDAYVLTNQLHEWQDVQNPMLVLKTQESALGGWSVSTENTFEEVLARGNRKRKVRKFKKQEKDLGELGGYELIEVTDAEAKQASYDLFVEQKIAWMKKRGISTDFASVPTRAFFHKLAALETTSEQDALRFFTIEINGECHAMFACGLWNNQAFGYILSTSEDERYTKIAPGALLVHRVIEQACSTHLTRVDYGVGDERYKASWCNERHALFNTLLSVSALGKLYCTSYGLRAQLEQSIRQNEAVWSKAKALRGAILGR